MADLNNELSKLLDEKILNCVDYVEVVSLLHGYSEFDLKSTTLGKAFEKMYANEVGFSPLISMSDLVTIHHSFKTTNGSTWNRSNSSYLGKKYEIKREHKNGKISAIKLEGFNRRRTISNIIRSDIVNYYKNKPCAILDINTNLECDHKDGLKDDWRLNEPSSQKFEDFQSLCKTANDAKRSHCKKCKDTGKRYDAKKLGYKVSYLYGDENTKNCEGCYWYDPKKFNSIISNDYKKIS